MQTLSRMLRLGPLAAALLVVGAVSWAQGVAPATGQPGQWVTRDINFTYVGLVTRYSCDGLVDYMRQVLVVLGARETDLNIHATGCTAAAGQIESFPGVAGTFSVLVNSSAGGVGEVPAEWQRVDVTADASYCELLQQVGRKVLPLFTARNAQFSTSCSAGMVGSQKLTAEVLAPVLAKPR